MKIRTREDGVMKINEDNQLINVNIETMMKTTSLLVR